MPPKIQGDKISYNSFADTFDQKYQILPEVMEEYYGIRDKLKEFLKEISGPDKNWKLIINETRSFALNYFHILQTHPKGPEVANLYIDIFFQAIDSSTHENVRINACDNLLFFIRKIIKDIGINLFKFLPVLDYTFIKIERYPKETFFLFIKSFYQINSLGKIYAQEVSTKSDFTAINQLLIKYFQYTYDYWLDQIDPVIWFKKETERVEFDAIFESISHKQLKIYKKRLESMASSSNKSSKTFLNQIIKLPGYGQIVAIYGEIPQKLLCYGNKEIEGRHWKLLFLLHIMEIQGLSSIHEETLRKISRTLVWLIQHKDPSVIQQYLEKTFYILKRSIKKFPGTVLNCISKIGKEVYGLEENELVEYFVDLVVSLDFQVPNVKGISKDWQIIANPAHIQNIRTWIELINLNPRLSKKLVSYLIIHLSLSGILIKDTDLLSRDITRLLNSDIEPVYNLIKQLTRLLPVYFNDIGAQGKLRDISTEIDEICMRKDPLVHFLRKQSHVESSNQIVNLMEAILLFWKTTNKKDIKPFVPPDVYEQIETEGPNIDGVSKIINHLFRDEKVKNINDFLSIENDYLHQSLDEILDVSELDRKRIELAVSFYKLLYNKYYFETDKIDNYLAQLQSSGLPDLEKLRKVFQEKDAEFKLKKLLVYLERLKNIILSSKDFEIRENLYRKRHFTVDIPSMYGNYHELKFDALGLTFRLESIVNVLFEEIINTMDLKLITKATFSEIFNYLSLFNLALELDGISSLEMKRQLDLLDHSLKIMGFTLTQYLDIFRGFSQAVRNIINHYFNSIYYENLSDVLDKMPVERLLPKYLPADKSDDRKKNLHSITEIFLRDRISSSLGLQQLDLFLVRILGTLYHQSHELQKKELRLLLSYNPKKIITPIYPAKRCISNVIHLGNKGFNLVQLKSYGLPVPPGFIITTEVFRCRDIVNHYEPAKRNFEEQVTREIAALEKLTGKTFGDTHNPLLLAIRSGSVIPQPGMMTTFLDVGINEDIVCGIAKKTGNDWFSWDTYRRFLQSYGMAFGMERDKFDDIISHFKKQLGKRDKREFSGSQMKDIALNYKSLILDNGIEIKDSPFEQLFVAINKVFDSWYAPKSETYRKILGISNDWGTAVIVQAMVFGNFSHASSGTGVFFTHSPRRSEDKLLLWGDFTLGNQGEDVASGLVVTLPISIKQAQTENRSYEKALESMFPEIYKSINRWAEELFYKKKWGPQEIEFTFQSLDPKDLYAVQTRNMVIEEREKFYSFDLEDKASVDFLGRGIAVSGSAMTGRIVFDLEEIQYWRKAEPGTSLILVRNDTVPDDIKEVYQSDGLLTGRGGSTSHAAIVAQLLGKTCVVGCTNLICLEKQKTCSLDGKALKSGDWISIDGLKGYIYSGQIKIKEMENYKNGKYSKK